MKKIVKDKLTFYTFEEINRKETAIFVTTRSNGFSVGTFHSLNLGLHVGDNMHDVEKNRRLVFEKLDLDINKLTCPEQVHGSNVNVVTEKDVGKGNLNYETSILETDALITNLKNVPLMVVSADCLAISFIDIKNKIIGIAHAGWKGTLGKIAGKTIDKMITEFGSDPKDILIGFSPSVGQCCYKVGVEVVTSFFDVFGEDAKNYFLINDGNFYLDLVKVNYKIVVQKGVLEKNIEVSNICTSCNDHTFFSHRKDGGQTGRFGTIISLSI
ncbi:MAG: hypothetical protein UT66_C0001G0030 [candidate division CPR2 bacterium GW2011_GWC1_39_9]|uniref:Purine nucleoside phosphorylase n=1 Tax=candidate division CPR2 bacterium GW2011_GWC2_39_10 TaxID=1618345 RepID=A0A0G0M566_UNCC2|nr:MAG: hypothetical protein UT18_C0001G0032 [candidate division CPR2 bacterium GW2011_GWC2_39_10]KKR36206.1 MAG: hypothetical protein UT66_C0001G0030 [candidate division CPR2 bacterium GW2011_GWC1_39_9]